MEQEETQFINLRNIANSPKWANEQLLRLAFKNLSLALSASVLCAFATVILFWPVADSRLLIAWLGCICLKTMLCLVMGQKFEHAHNVRQHVFRWHNAYVFSTFSAGLLWGSLSIFLLTDSSMLHIGYLSLILAGVSAGAISVYSPLPGAFPAFAVTTLLPFAGQFVRSGTAEGFLLAGLVTAFLLLLMSSSSESRNHVRELLDLQVRNGELTRALHHRATHDSLVDLANHGEFKRQLARLADRNRRDSNDYALVFVDLDLFKEVNDSGGHAAGDLILKGIAKILKSRTRAGDTAARVGGDEFALLLDDCGEQRAVQIAEDIRRDIEDLRVEYDGQQYSVKASIGVSFGRTNKHSATSMLKSADVACYMAKEDGRNTVRSNPASDMFQTTDRFQLAQVPEHA